MIKSISFKNFKGFTELPALEIKPITILVGRNSAGKSSIHQAITLMAQSLLAPDREKTLDGLGPLIDIGLYKDFAYQNSYDNELEFTIELSQRKSSPPAKYCFRFRGLMRTQRIECIKQVYEYDNRTIELFEPEREKKSKVTLNGKKKPELMARQYRNFLFNIENKSDPLSFFVNQNEDYRFGRELSRHNQSIISFFQKTFYVGPLRAVPKRYYELKGHSPFYVGPSGENAVHILLYEHQRIVLGEHRHILKRVNQWLAYLGLAKNIDIDKIAEVATISFPQQESEHYATLPALGFGLSQIFPIIVQSVASPEGSLHLFEQPEIHLHPALQAQIADLFVSCAVEDHKHFIIETHSEHMIRGLQLAVAKGEISSDSIAIYYVNNHDADTPLIKMEIDSKGNLRRDWPVDFYNLGYKLTRELLREQAAHSQINAKEHFSE